MTWLHQHFIRGTFAPLYIDTKINCAVTNIKLTRGETIQIKILQVIGFKHYPSKNSVHYKLLQLHKYDIEVNRRNFLLKHSHTKEEN